MAVAKKNVVSFRLDAGLQEPVDKWLKINHISFSRLINMAVMYFITKEHLLKPVTVTVASDQEVDDSTVRMMKKHEDALERLK